MKKPHHDLLYAKGCGFIIKNHLVMQQFQDDIMKNRKMIEKVNKVLLEKIEALEKRISELEKKGQ